MSTNIRVGVGGWTFEPWRDNFYPKGWPQKMELAYASRQLTAIEVNGTFYSRFGPDTFAKWRDEAPPDFVYALKAHRFATHRRDLGTAGDGVRNFVESGIAQLGDKLGPIVWQFMPSTAYDREHIASFLRLLPREVAGRPLRHVLDARHASFASDDYLDLLAEHGCTTVYTDAPQFPALPHARCELAYLRLMKSDAGCATGYPPDELARWVDGARRWVAQGEGHEAFVFFINGAKERAPAAAQEFLRQLGWQPIPISPS
jgi:uncharacterized protein YecE (DUF72 family)